MYRSMHSVIPIWLLLLGSANATCSLSPVLTLPSYSPLAATSGTLTVTVICDQPGERAVLRLDAPMARTVAGGDVLLPLTNARQQTVMVRLVGGSLWTRGTPIRGNDVLSLPVVADANQWNGLGHFSANVTFLVQATPLSSAAVNGPDLNPTAPNLASPDLASLNFAPLNFAPFNFANALPTGSQNETLP